MENFVRKFRITPPLYKCIVVLCVAIATLALAACSGIAEEGAEKKVRINLPPIASGARSISDDRIPDLKGDVRRYRVTVNGTTREGTGSSYEFTLPVGVRASVTVECLNSNGDVIIRAEKAFVVSSGENNFSINLKNDGTEIVPASAAGRVTYSWGEADRHGNKDGLPSDTTTYKEGDLFEVKDGASMTWDHGLNGGGFTGWSASVAIEPENGVQATNAPTPGQKYKMPKGGVTLTAQWNKKSYTITYDMNASGSGGTQTSTPINQGSVQALEDYTIDSTTPASVSAGVKNYTFMEWSDGNGNTYAVGRKITNVTGDITLTAQWSDKNVWTVTYSKGSTQASTQGITNWIDSDNAEDGNSVTLPTLQATGYTFNGWQITGETGNKTGSYTPTQSVTATAQWTPITYNIRLNTTNSNWSSVAGQISGQATVTATYDSAATLTAITPPSNYTFAGWAKADGATSAASDITQSGGSYTATNLANTQGTTVDLYPVWTPIPYNITYSNTNGGTGSADTTNATTSFTIETSPITFASEGTLEKIAYAFDGWETTSGTPVSGKNASELIALITSGDTLELQVKWIDGKRTVVYDTGLLVLNELPGNRKTDATLAVYAAMKDDGSNYRFNTWDGKPWNAVKDSITSVEVGSPMQPTSTANWFYDLTECTSINLTNLDTSRVTTMEDMFRNCSKLTTLDLTMFDTSNVTTMFEMFCYCSALTTVRFGSSFNTAKVTAMSGMFDTCVALTSLDVTNFNTSRVTSFYRMFKTCRALTTLDISSFDTSSVTADYAFPSMFAECSSLTTIFASSSFQTDNVTASDDMFADCTSLVGGQNTIFNAINPTDHTYARIDGGPGSSTPGYFTQKP